MPVATDPEEILRFLIMQHYVDANLQLGKSENSKVIFMNPRDISENIDSLLRESNRNQRRNSNSNGNQSKE
jgi:hypothetical protein